MLTQDQLDAEYRVTAGDWAELRFGRAPLAFEARQSAEYLMWALAFGLLLPALLVGLGLGAQLHDRLGWSEKAATPIGLTASVGALFLATYVLARFTRLPVWWAGRRQPGLKVQDVEIVAVERQWRYGYGDTYHAVLRFSSADGGSFPAPEVCADFDVRGLFRFYGWKWKGSRERAALELVRLDSFRPAEVPLGPRPRDPAVPFVG